MEHVATGIIVQPWEIVAAAIGLATFSLSVVIMGFSFLNHRFDRLEDKIGEKLDKMQEEIHENAKDIAALTGVKNK